MITLTETNIAPENKVSKRKVVFPPCIFRGDVSVGGVSLQLKKILNQLEDPDEEVSWEDTPRKINMEPKVMEVCKMIFLFNLAFLVSMLQ